MVTKEQLLARRAQLDLDLEQQQALAHQAEADRVAAIARAATARDYINALSGAKQDVEFWLKQFPADPPPTDEPNKTPEPDPKELPN